MHMLAWAIENSMRNVCQRPTTWTGANFEGMFLLHPVYGSPLLHTLTTLQASIFQPLAGYPPTEAMRTRVLVPLSHANTSSSQGSKIQGSIHPLILRIRGLEGWCTRRCVDSEELKHGLAQLPETAVCWRRALKEHYFVHTCFKADFALSLRLSRARSAQFMLSSCSSCLPKHLRITRNSHLYPPRMTTMRTTTVRTTVTNKTPWIEASMKMAVLNGDGGQVKGGDGYIGEGDALYDDGDSGGGDE
ncbi:hypothetical protein F5878DRAFT_642161 [Lentinula raphanica]|uniref:Uncharacterized protein n=1 Tax=Lentinula raphanica TaxID=153919 RepID=A0AA38P8F5_9AGAR|nr:hypothetical protein F5878DRAFT_642161 [Lentinula raphanica]